MNILKTFLSFVILGSIFCLILYYCTCVFGTLFKMCLLEFLIVNCWRLGRNCVHVAFTWLAPASWEDIRFEKAQTILTWMHRHISCPNELWYVCSWNNLKRLWACFMYHSKRMRLATCQIFPKSPSNMNHIRISLVSFFPS